MSHSKKMRFLFVALASLPMGWSGVLEASPPILHGTINLGPHLGKDLALKREDASFKLKDPVVKFDFHPTNKEDDIKEILFGKARSSESPDFHIVTDMAGRRGKRVTEFILCSWDDDTKKQADCSIEDDGGRFKLLVDAANNALTLELNSDANAFTIAEEPETGEGVGAGYTLSLWNSDKVDLPIQLRQ